MASFWDAHRTNDRRTDNKDLSFSLRKRRVFIHLSGLDNIYSSPSLTHCCCSCYSLRLIYDNKWLDKLFNWFRLKDERTEGEKKEIERAILWVTLNLGRNGEKKIREIFKHLFQISSLNWITFEPILVIILRYAARPCTKSLSAVILDRCKYPAIT